MSEVNTLMVNPGSPWYYRPSWYATIEDHMYLLRDTTNSELITVADIDRHRYEADFYGYLRDVHTIKQPQYWYVILRVNHMTSPQEFGADNQAIFLPKTAVVDRIMELFKTAKGIG